MENQITFTPDQVLRAVKGWCFDCGSHPPSYMVHNELWYSMWKPPHTLSKKFRRRLAQLATTHFPERQRSKDSNLVLVKVRLCFGCLELRMGRLLKITDFIVTTREGRPLHDNAGIFLGYKLGGEAVARKKRAESGNKKEEGE